VKQPPHALLIAVFLLALLSTPGFSQNSDADATLVIFNNLDPQSGELAGYYAKQRSIPFDRVIGLDCTMNETMTREEYDRTIAEPLRAIFNERGWWKFRKTSDSTFSMQENKIRFIALIRGIPLRIGATPIYEGDKKNGVGPVIDHNEASVDSELACLGYFSKQISGALNNPYFRSFTKITEANLAPLMLVARLDGPDAKTVRRMINDAVETEQTGLWGFAYIDSRNIHEGQLSEGDKWLRRAADDARTHGLPVIHDNGPDMFSQDYPMRHAALYYGWYADNVTGPFVREDFQFNKGAVAVHIHSYSAATLREPGRHWASPLLSRGATATLGNVFEPFLGLTPNLDLFHERLREGFTFAESAYMATKIVSWMNTVIGDPLYKPFKLVQDGAAPKSAAEWIAYRKGALQWHEDRAAGERTLMATGQEMRSGIIFEGLASLQAHAEDYGAALKSFQQARQFYTAGEDITRVGIREVSLLRGTGKPKQAIALARKLIVEHPKAHGSAVLSKIEGELNPAVAPKVPEPAQLPKQPFR
jgi:uncharacterized protein (TIGR03790 family)